MARTLPACALLAALLALPAAPAAPGPAETVVALTVHPAAAPRPLFRHLLLPEVRELNPGNPIPAYLKCFMEQQNFFFNKDVVAEREQFLNMPLKDLPRERLRGYGGNALTQADYAARLDTPDWQVLLKFKREGVHFLLPEVQQLRSLASALKVRLRGEIADGRFDDAVRTAKTMLALARHLGEHPTLIGNLVGIAIASIALGPLEELVQQPGAPNLYWALTDLPKPFIDLHKAVSGERILIDATLAGLDPDTPLSDAQLKKIVARVAVLAREMNGPADVAAWLAARAKDPDHLRDARQRLAAAGVVGKALPDLPPVQVILLDEKLTFEARRDEESRWVSVPFWEAEPRPGPVEARVAGVDDSLFGGGIMVSYWPVHRAQLRLEQRLALLRHVEAIRLYAAAHGGKVPEQLGDTGLPLPPDPFTGKPFVYSGSGRSAGLRGTPPRGEENNPIYNVRFLITVAP